MQFSPNITNINIDKNKYEAGLLNRKGEMEFGIHATELLSAGDFVIGSSMETTPVQLKIFENLQNKK